jgi:hypothetical protein
LANGAYATGVLTALRIEDDAVGLLQARGEPSDWSPPPPRVPSEPADFEAALGELSLSRPG